MKPPFRRRTGPSRFRKITQPENLENTRTLCKGWIRKDLQSFLHALKQQDFESELDLTEIQKKIPKRSLKEIEDLVNTLKSRVLQKVHLQFQTQRKEERKAKVPIEIWADHVQKISRSHEKTISTAFSQMLVVAATEPCGLMHSDTPHPITQTLAFSNLQCVHSFKTPSRPSTSGMSPNSSVSTASAVSFIQPDSSSSAVDHIGKSDTASSSLPQAPTMPATPTTTSSSSQLQSEAPVSSPVSTAPVSPSASSDKHNPALMELLGHDYLHKPRIMKSVVNFHKIYQYLSGTDSKTCSSGLTSMECAVLLDVLMCLPEELPLLDCKELQHHLLQLHSQLSKPTVKLEPSPNVPLTDSTTSAQKPSTTAGSSEEPSYMSEPARDKEDWATAGICPLNPLSVPVTLLKRKSLDSEK